MLGFIIQTQSIPPARRQRERLLLSLNETFRVEKPTAPWRDGTRNIHPSNRGMDLVLKAPLREDERGTRLR
jgi:hypothetical protein